MPKPKKPKLIRPDCVRVGKNLFSVKTSTRGDRCFVVYDEETRFCEQEKCKTRRAVTVASTEMSVASSNAYKCGSKNCKVISGAGKQAEFASISMCFYVHLD